MAVTAAEMKPPNTPQSQNVLPSETSPRQRVLTTFFIGRPPCEEEVKGHDHI